MAQRVTYRRRHGYATKSNKTKLVKTPGTFNHCFFCLLHSLFSLVLSAARNTGGDNSVSSNGS